MLSKFDIAPQLKDPEWLKNEHETKSYEQIAKELGLGETTIWSLAKEYGIKSKSRSERLKGRVFTEEHRNNLSKSRIGKMTGASNHKWKGGVSKNNHEKRLDNEYHRWRKYVIRRADKKCEKCGRIWGDICKCCGVKMKFYAHHIKPFAEFPELRYEVDNGIYLCQICHDKEHNKG